MEQIRKLIWNGAINTQILIDESLLVGESSEGSNKLNVRVLRDVYIVHYLCHILEDLRIHLRDAPERLLPYLWFECGGQPLPWNYPIGVLYDSMRTQEICGYYKVSRSTLENTVNVWKIRLRYGTETPATCIPLIDGIKQVKKYWMHQWKQVCYILNGSSKQIMSLSIKDSDRFWQSVLRRDMATFEDIKTKIVPKSPRSLPLIIHGTPAVTLQPVVHGQNDDGTSATLADVLRSATPEYFDERDVFTGTAVSNGIQIPIEMALEKLYFHFMSFDGFLHIVIDKGQYMQTCQEKESIRSVD